eukprot:NODE_16318_length_206_cov_4.783439_g15405_i0.p1 GENE.NODE_16318_length_206_cov_4.783439_g15405_i0~~NODE_16318_length_206_cov_4.783439_g15405_i0.p1  ORF type:complete len:64 (-),score=7.96 NODE_16318_length_206_cov_4.783439_g15405_i0:15-185(-)
MGSTKNKKKMQNYNEFILICCFAVLTFLGVLTYIAINLYQSFTQRPAQDDEESLVK